MIVFYFLIQGILLVSLIYSSQLKENIVGEEYKYNKYEKVQLWFIILAFIGTGISILIFLENFK